ncbi:MAG: HEAT repeat domain-containing protein [Dehalococcoidia bacterium]
MTGQYDNGYLPLGPSLDEDESSHLQRVAAELGAANHGLVQQLARRLEDGDEAVRRQAAADLGKLGDRESIAVLRLLLVSDDVARWELAVYGLRHSREREGWLCLEGVALESVPALAHPDPRVHRRAAMRMLAMGRTKTMDRLFRAIDGHSRSIPQDAARRFVELAVASLPGQHATVMSLRLGLKDGTGRTPGEVASATGMNEDLVRMLEAEAWQTIQSPRSHTEIAALAGNR